MLTCAPVLFWPLRTSYWQFILWVHFNEHLLVFVCAYEFSVRCQWYWGEVQLAGLHFGELAIGRFEAQTECCRDGHGARLAPSNRRNACAGSTQLVRRKWASGRAHNLAVCPWNTWPVCASERAHSFLALFAPVETLRASDGLKRRGEGSWQTKAGEVARRVCRQWCEWTA